jgi:hypothetical protein
MYHKKTAAHLGGYTHSLSDSFAIGQGGYAPSQSQLQERGPISQEPVTSLPEQTDTEVIK